MCSLGKMSAQSPGNGVTLTVFCNLYEEKNTSDIPREASVLPSVLLTPLKTFLPEKQRLSPAKNFSQVFVLEKITAMVSPPPTKTSVNFPPENSLSPRKRQSQIGSSLLKAII